MKPRRLFPLFTGTFVAVVAAIGLPAATLAATAFTNGNFEIGT